MRINTGVFPCFTVFPTWVRCYAQKYYARLKFEKGESSSVTTEVSYHTEAAIDQILDQIMYENEDMSRDMAEMYLYSSGLKIYTNLDLFFLYVGVSTNSSTGLVFGKGVIINLFHTVGESNIC